MKITVTKVKRELEKNYGWNDITSRSNPANELINELIKDTLKIIDLDTWLSKNTIKQPVSEGKTAKEFIKEKAKTNPLIKGMETNIALIELLNEFASQSLTQVLPSKEEIEKAKEQGYEISMMHISNNAVKWLSSYKAPEQK
jgi:hypothetical protein